MESKVQYLSLLRPFLWLGGNMGSVGASGLLV